MLRFFVEPEADEDARGARRRGMRVDGVQTLVDFGDRGDVLGVERFGASAPADILLREYGFTVDNVAARARKLLTGMRSVG